jgi:hypothetical protein
MGQAELRGEPCAEDRPAARERSVGQAPAALTAPEPLSGGSFGRPRALGVRNLTDTVPILGRIFRQPVGIRGISPRIEGYLRNAG